MNNRNAGTHSPLLWAQSKNSGGAMPLVLMVRVLGLLRRWWRCDPRWIRLLFLVLWWLYIQIVIWIRVNVSVLRIWIRIRIVIGLIEELQGLRRRRIILRLLIMRSVIHGFRVPVSLERVLVQFLLSEFMVLKTPKRGLSKLIWRMKRWKFRLKCFNHFIMVYLLTFKCHWTIYLFNCI